MSLTYTELNTLRTDTTFRGRCAIGVIKAADTVLNETAGTPAHELRLRWANLVYSGPTGPDTMADKMMPRILADSNVQTDGDAVTDSTLQDIVDALVNTMAGMG